jgi:hypothetical protein
LHDAFSVPKAGTYIPSGGTYIPCRRTYIPAFGTENIPTKTSKHISNNDVKKAGRCVVARQLFIRYE